MQNESCERTTCKGCHKISHPKVQSCQIRTNEWLKGIYTILDKNRAPGEGQAMAEEFIRFMRDEFMGGT